MNSSASNPLKLPKPLERPDPASLKLLHYPQPVLKKIAKDVHQFDAWLAAVVERSRKM